MEAQVIRHGDIVRVSGEMTIYAATELRDALFPALTGAARIELDLAGVTGMDTAGLQLLLMVRRMAHATGASLRIVNPSGAVTDVLDLCGQRALVEQRP